MTNRPRFGFVVEYVTDIEAAKDIYVNVLGLEVERYSPMYIQFEHFAIASDESMSGNRERELYWLVEDAEAALRDLSGKADVSMPLKQMPFGKVFGIKNLDGQPLYLLELSKDRPSQVVK
jgi:catechol 2,3-dioxygenase-like lactoylglutathione lyase family enzyme